jgi:hypothetical protein
MLRYFLRVVVALTWVVAVGVAFLVVSARSDAWPLPTGSALLATSWSGRESADEFRDALEKFALDEQITVAQVFEASDSRADQRLLYLIDGDKRLLANHWAEQGIGNFGGFYEYRVQSYRELDHQSPQGLYFVFGDVAEGVMLQEFLSSRGMSTQLTEVGLLDGVPPEAGIALVIFSLLLAALAGIHVVAGTRRYAIGRLHGLSYASLLRRDVGSIVTTWALSGVVVCGASTAAVLAAFGGTGLGFFLGSILVIEFVFVAAAVSSHMIVLAALGTVAIQPALKGRLPTRSLAGSAYALRMVSVLLALTTVGTVLALADDLAARDRAQQQFDDLDDLSTITLGNIFSPEDEEAAIRAVGSWLRGLDRNGDLLLAQQEIIEQSPQWAGTRRLAVNTEFIERQPVQLADGSRLTRDTLASDALTVVVPSPRWSERAALPQALGLEALVVPGVEADIAFERSEPGQDVFTFTPDSRDRPSFLSLGEEASMVRDPVILVLPSDRGWLRDVNYMAFMSEGSATVSSPAVFEEAVRADPELERFLRAATPVREEAARLIAEVSLDLRYSVFSALMGCAVVIISGAAATLVYTRHIAQRAFVRHIHGWSLGAIYRPILVVEAALLVGMLAVIPVRTLRERREIAQFEEAAGGAPLPIDSPTLGGEEWGAMVALTLILVGGFVLALLAAHRRVVREGASTA